MVFLRRLLWLVMIVGAAYAGYVAWQRRGDGHDDPPEWPPFPATSTPGPDARIDAGPTPGSTPVSPTDAPDPEPGDTPTWVEPIDGACPVTHPVKLKASSGIFHLPGGRSYDRTNPDRCYASAEAAEADGYRAAKT